MFLKILNLSNCASFVEDGFIFSQKYGKGFFSVTTLHFLKNIMQVIQVFFLKKYNIYYFGVCNI